MKLSELVKINNRFEKSVNLLLDLYSQDKIDGYIPTRSSVKVLGEYIHEVLIYSGNRASVLIGPYGKGKSHLLLMLMKILSQSCPTSVIENLLQRISVINKDVADEIQQVLRTKGPFLPVILNAGLEPLNRTFMRGLTSALQREGLEDVVPDSYFSEALKMIRNWEKNFPETYALFLNKIAPAPIENFVQRLAGFDEKALVKFREVYPALTSGGVFNPIIDSEIVSVYQSVNRTLREKHGYSGIYIIFDEFSKYIEGHRPEGFSEDMKVLQDMCELSNASRDDALHLTCVAHKSIKAYGNTLPQEVLNSFKGVEGRLKEVDFIVSSKNNYELLSDAITKLPAFEDWAKGSTPFRKVTEASYSIRSFNSLFTQEDYQQIVGNGCFPLTPVSALLLLNLCEQIAQNERTIFTYITSRDPGGLARYVEQSKLAGFVGADSIYDYFLPVFKDEVHAGIHHEWLKADYALSLAESSMHKTIIKCIAVIRMVNIPNEIIASSKYIAMATGLDPKRINAAINELVDSKLIEFKSRTGAYEFKNNIGIDVEQAIKDCMKKRYMNADIGMVLASAVKEKYVLPKKHNQTYRMTRYFNMAYMSYPQFMAMQSTSYLEWKNCPDGVIIFILPSEELDECQVAMHTSELRDPCLIVCLPKQMELCTDEARYLLAVQHLHGDKSFIDDNLVVKRELESIAEETIYTLNAWVERTYFPLGAVFGAEGKLTVGPLGLNRLVSDICDVAYNRTPIINNESINRHNIATQIAKARKNILNDILYGIDTVKYETGTSAESTIYRAVFSHTKGDMNLVAVQNEFADFFASCVDGKKKFSDIINRLLRPPFGMRRGLLPFYLMDSLLQQKSTPILYLEDKEVPLNTETVINIIKMPQSYSLYVELDSVQKNRYIHDLEDLFSDYAEYCHEFDRRNQLARIACMMQSWYRSLPQTSKVFSEPDYESQDIRALTKFRKVFSEMYLNPRDIIFERIPRIFKVDNLADAYWMVKNAKRDIDKHIDYVRNDAESILRNEFHFTPDSDLRQNFLAWLDAIPDAEKRRVYPLRTEKLLSCIKSVSSNIEADIIGRIVREVTGVFIEDWRTGQEKEFQRELSTALSELTVCNEDTSGRQQKILLTGDDENPIERFFQFDESELSTNAIFFKSAVEDLLEEYDSVLETNEKLGVLIEAIRKIMM